MVVKVKPGDKYCLLGSAGEFWPSENEESFEKFGEDISEYVKLIVDELDEHISQVRVYGHGCVGKTFEAHVVFYGFDEGIWDDAKDWGVIVNDHCVAMCDDIVWIKTCLTNNVYTGEGLIDAQKDQYTRLEQQALEAGAMGDMAGMQVLHAQALEHRTAANKLITEYKQSCEYTYSQAQERWTLWEGQMKTKLSEIDARIERYHQRLAGKYVPE